SFPSPSLESGQPVGQRPTVSPSDRLVGAEAPAPAARGAQTGKPKRADAKWDEQLNPDLKERRAWAADQLQIDRTGAAIIKDELRESLRVTYTDDVIDGALAQPKYFASERDPEKRVHALRTACRWVKERKDKEAAKGGTKPKANRTFTGKKM